MNTEKSSSINKKSNKTLIDNKFINFSKQIN